MRSERRPATAPEHLGRRHALSGLDPTRPLILRCPRSCMAPTTHLPARVARRFQAAVLLRDQHETDEYIGTCSEGASVGTSEVLQLLVSRGIEPNEVRFTKRLADNMTRFEAGRARAR